MINNHGLSIIIGKFLFCSLFTLIFLAGYLYLSYEQQTSANPVFTTIGCALTSWYTVVRSDHLIMDIRRTNKDVHRVNNLTLTAYKWTRKRGVHQ